MSYIRVAVVAGNGVSSRAIEWFGGGGWSHFASVISDNEVIDARSDLVHWKGAVYPKGVQVRPLGYLLEERKWMLIDVPCAKIPAEEWQAALRKQLGKPYDTQGIWDFVSGKLRNQDWRDPSSWFCSELGIWAMESAGICPSLLTGVNRITPGAALLICAALGGRVVGRNF